VECHEEWPYCMPLLINTRNGEMSINDAMLRNPENSRKGGHEMVEQMSRRPIKGEDPCFFDITLQHIDGIGSARHVHNPSTRRMKSKQLGMRNLYVLVVRRERDR
jgi:hypothetical protein